MVQKQSTSGLVALFQMQIKQLTQITAIVLAANDDRRRRRTTWRMSFEEVRTGTAIGHIHWGRARVFLLRLLKCNTTYSLTVRM